MNAILCGLCKKLEALSSSVSRLCKPKPNHEAVINKVFRIELPAIYATAISKCDSLLRLKAISQPLPNSP